MNIIQPTMFEESTVHVCLLKKALYGLKQSLLNLLRKPNFQKTKSNNSLFVSADQPIFIAVYIDDLIFFGSDIDPQINDVMQNLQDRFRMTDLGDVSHYLGMEFDVDFSKKTITVQKFTYLKKILGRYRINDCRLAKIFISPGVVNSLSRC